MGIYPKCYFNADRLCFIKRLSETSFEFIFLKPDEDEHNKKLFKPYHFKKEKTEQENADEFVKDASPISLEEYQTVKNNLFQHDQRDS